MAGIIRSSGGLAGSGDNFLLMAVGKQRRGTAENSGGGKGKKVPEDLNKLMIISKSWIKKRSIILIGNMWRQFEMKSGGGRIAVVKKLTGV
jgi:hypothetical protein